MNHHLPQFPVDFPELKSAFAVSFREWVSYRSMEAHRNKRASEMIRSDSDPFLWKSRIMWRKGNLWLSVQLKGGVEIGKSIRADTGIPSKHSKVQFPSHWLIDFPWFTPPISVIHSTNSGFRRCLERLRQSNFSCQNDSDDTTWCSSCMEGVYLYDP